MLNTKFDLYDAEWLDLVFSDRNKEYGAYELRKSYSTTMLHAMGHTFGTIAFFCTLAYIVARYTPIEELTKTTTVYIKPDIPVVIPPKKVEPPKQQKTVAPAKQLAPAASSQFTTPKPTNEPVNTDPPKNADLGANISAVKTDGPGTIAPIDPPGPVGPPAAPAATGNELVPFSSLESMPEPMGGFDAFSKFLGRNLRFPAQAQDAGVSGKVIVSFVIEKNGELSNITLERGAGYGFDQEAARVLKLAKAWKPGKQNGQPVRVKYQIPINFQLPSE